MSREIKFRGMTKDKKWVYGNLIINNERESDGIHKKESLHTFIREQNKRWNAGNKCWTHFGYEVLPETVGQFTGLKDKDEKEAYCQDISQDGDGDKYVVDWDADEGIYYLKGIGINCIGLKTIDLELSDIKNQKVIGNVHSNPELLGEQK